MPGAIKRMPFDDLYFYVPLGHKFCTPQQRILSVGVRSLTHYYYYHLLIQSVHKCRLNILHCLLLKLMVTYSITCIIDRNLLKCITEFGSRLAVFRISWKLMSMCRRCGVHVCAEYSSRRVILYYRHLVCGCIIICSASCFPQTTNDS